MPDWLRSPAISSHSKFYEYDCRFLLLVCRVLNFIGRFYSFKLTLYASDEKNNEIQICGIQTCTCQSDNYEFDDFISKEILQLRVVSMNVIGTVGCNFDSKVEKCQTVKALNARLAMQPKGNTGVGRPKSIR